VELVTATEHKSPDLYIGVDIGGTFTDFVIYDSETGKISTSKRLSTPANPAQAVLEGLKDLLDDNPRGKENIIPHYVITHGSTVATNALLEKKGSRTGLVTTKGFRDVIQIGRQDRPVLYDLAVKPRPQLIPNHLRFEVNERIDHQGKILQELNQQELVDLVSQINSEDVESIAICLLFSFLYPDHEQIIAQLLREHGYFVSVSSEILPEYREYERTSTTVVNAYVTPTLDRYLGNLENSLTDNNGSLHLRVMQSNGGIIGLSEARQAGVRCILSGPAGGVVGASHLACLAQISSSPRRSESDLQNDLKLITFDMGGTSTDVSLIDNFPAITTESIVGGHPIRIPVLDIHTIGAGGGSIASVDLGGALRVGPESAGADPGPACYARGNATQDLPTVTDANVFLGRLPIDHFLGGEMQLDAKRAEDVLAKLGRKLKLSIAESAHGVIEVINAHMERAIRLVSIERGYDPQEFVLLSFGGAGGLHACELARKLGIPKVIVPPLASTLSAFGMLVADVIKDYSQTVMLTDDTPGENLFRAFKPLEENGIRDLQHEGFISGDIQIEYALDMRYRGQSYELTIPFGNNYLEDFHRHHEDAYGYARRDSEVEIVNLRLRATGIIDPPALSTSPIRGENPGLAYLGDRQAFLEDEPRPVPLYQGELLTSGNTLFGPAIVVRKDTTVYLTEKDLVYVDHYGNLVISIS
jgi:N-methylhydantoinase A